VRGYLAACCQVIAATPQGERNAAMAKIAYDCGGLSHYGVTLGEMERELLGAARSAGWRDDVPGKTESTCRRQLEEGAAKPRELGDREEPRKDGFAAWAVGGEAGEPIGGTSAAATVGEVLDQWRTEGPLVHEPTDIAELDRLTDGGPVYGSRWYLLGAPDAGKTALLVQLADVYLDRGVAVGLLGVDEEPSDLVMRLAQRHGYTRAECERRTPETLSGVRLALEGLPLRLYDAAWTIERAAADLAAYAAELGTRALLGVDSIQTVTCATEDPQRSVRESVTARAWAIRAAAQRHRLIAIATSEMNRAAYRSVEAAEASDDLAAAKESGAIEFSARVLLALRSVAGEPDLVELRVAKNKHGPRGDKIHLRLSRSRQTLVETEAPEVEDIAELRDARAHEAIARTAVALVGVLLERPGLPTRALRAALAAKLGGCGKSRCQDAVAHLGRAVLEVPGTRTAVRHYLVGAHVPDSVLSQLEPAERARAAAARPPEETNDE
jgi:hypothetical protein